MNTLSSASLVLPIGATGLLPFLTCRGKPGPKTIEFGIQLTNQQPIPGSFYPLDTPAGLTAYAKISLINQRAQRVVYADLWCGQQISANAETVTVAVACEAALVASANVFACVHEGLANPGAMPPRFSKKFIIAGGSPATIQVPPFAAAYFVTWDESSIAVNSPITVEDSDATGITMKRTCNVNAAGNGVRYWENWVPLAGNSQFIRVTAANGLSGKVIFALTL